MAPVKQVRSLYEVSTDSVLKRIPHKIYGEHFEALRKHLITVLPGTIRNSLIEKAIIKYSFCVPALLNIVALLGDQSIKNLSVTKKGNYFSWSHCKQLFSTLSTYNITGLHELDIKACGEMGGCTQTEILSGLHKALSRGLASSLRVLSLHSAADNHTLKIIGSQALHLTHLEVTCSWLIDDKGIADLLLKDSSRVLSLPWPELESCHHSAINKVALLSPTELNRTCETLCEVKIQDTNTSSISVILLLLFAKKLKTFGGFLYDRNIGDIVLSVQSRRNAPPHLSLTELWDMDLPVKKLDKINKSLPNLTHLYTRMTWLPEVPNMIPPLTHLTTDFDFVHYGKKFFSFLEHYGTAIRKLVLIDQVYHLDIVTIALSCPKLEELSAKLYIENPNEKRTSLLQNLKFAEVRISSPQTFLWIMKQADNVKHLEVLLEHESGVQDMFEISILKKLIEENPKSLDSITKLSIHLLWRKVFEGIAFSCGVLQIDAAYMLCAACSSLTVLGELDTWLQVTEQDVLRMADHIKKNNWNVKLIYRSNLYPQS